MNHDINNSLQSRDADSIPISEVMQRSKFSPALTSGCYGIAFKPYSSNFVFKGTIRLDKYTKTVSGDLYKFPGAPYELLRSDSLFLSDIPIYPRQNYYSYLKVTELSWLTTFYSRGRTLKLSIEEYEYIQPTEGYNGSFPQTPSRKFTVLLSNANPGLREQYFIGTLTVDEVEQGEFRMTWISPFFRRATLQISTTSDAIPPKPVKARNGIGTESFRTISSSGGWDLNVIYSNVKLIPPSNTTTLAGDTCPSEEDLQALLTSMNSPISFLDQEWRLQLLVVPGKMGCSRGMLFDDNRKGVAVFSHDGYPKEDSEHFGSATGKQQWQVPRAYLRSAAHEVGHGFNQQHQYFTEWGEPGSDNSIMTTTPEVADYLANPTSRPPGVFPDDIDLRFNAHVRHHLIHFPDPVVRPGGMDFQAGHNTKVPEAD